MIETERERAKKKEKKIIQADCFGWRKTYIRDHSIIVNMCATA